jgi:hypothetical protein
MLATILPDYNALEKSEWILLTHCIVADLNRAGEKT